MTARDKEPSSSSKPDPQGVLAAILTLRKRLLAARHQNISCETVDVWLDSIDALLPDLKKALLREADKAKCD